MFTNKHFSHLCDQPKMWFKSLVYFLSDSRLTDPMRIGRSDDWIEDPVIWEVVYMNGM